MNLSHPVSIFPNKQTLKKLYYLNQNFEIENHIFPCTQLEYGGYIVTGKVIMKISATTSTIM